MRFFFYLKYFYDHIIGFIFKSHKYEQKDLMIVREERIRNLLNFNQKNGNKFFIVSQQERTFR